MEVELEVVEYWEEDILEERYWEEERCEVEDREVAAEGWCKRRNFTPELPVMKAEMWEIVGGWVSMCFRYLERT